MLLTVPFKKRVQGSNINDRSNDRSFLINHLSSFCNGFAVISIAVLMGDSVPQFWQNLEWIWGLIASSKLPNTSPMAIDGLDVTVIELLRYFLLNGRWQGSQWH